MPTAAELKVLLVQTEYKETAHRIAAKRRRKAEADSLARAPPSPKKTRADEAAAKSAAKAEMQRPPLSQRLLRPKAEATEAEAPPSAKKSKIATTGVAADNGWYGGIWVLYQRSK
jgi:hypothetical protein